MRAICYTRADRKCKCSDANESKSKRRQGNERLNVDGSITSRLSQKVTLVLAPRPSSRIAGLSSIRAYLRCCHAWGGFEVYASE